jgi:hypothetical protein
MVKELVWVTDRVAAMLFGHTPTCLELPGVHAIHLRCARPQLARLGRMQRVRGALAGATVMPGRVLAERCACWAVLEGTSPAMNRCAGGRSGAGRVGGSMPTTFPAATKQSSLCWALILLDHFQDT